MPPILNFSNGFNEVFNSSAGKTDERIYLPRSNLYSRQTLLSKRHPVNHFQFPAFDNQLVFEGSKHGESCKKRGCEISIGVSFVTHREWLNPYMYCIMLLAQFLSFNFEQEKMYRVLTKLNAT